MHVTYVRFKLPCRFHRGEPCASNGQSYSYHVHMS
jgi:hypothetical protein